MFTVETDNKQHKLDEGSICKLVIRLGMFWLALFEVCFRPLRLGLQSQLDPLVETVRARSD